jgi:hypothetical protein
MFTPLGIHRHSGHIAHTLIVLRSSGDPWNFAQTKSTILGKVIRIDVNTTASNPGYVIPPTNPYYNQTGVAQEVFATGFKNPWRCNFDRLRPTYLLCGDVGQVLRWLGFES